MDKFTGFQIVLTLVTIGGAGVALWQAGSAERSAEAAEESAKAAKRQNVLAERANQIAIDSIEKASALPFVTAKYEVLRELEPTLYEVIDWAVNFDEWDEGYKKLFEVVRNAGRDLPEDILELANSVANLLSSGNWRNTQLESLSKSNPDSPRVEKILDEKYKIHFKLSDIRQSIGPMFTAHWKVLQEQQAPPSAVM
jgi:hypothetical protein